MFAGNSEAPWELLARTAFEVRGDENRDPGALLQTVQQMRRLVRRPSIDHEPADAVVLGEPAPVAEVVGILGDVAAADLLADHLRGFLAERHRSPRLRRPPPGFLVALSPGRARERKAEDVRQEPRHHDRAQISKTRASFPSRNTNSWTACMS